MSIISSSTNHQIDDVNNELRPSDDATENMMHLNTLLDMDNRRDHIDNDSLNELFTLFADQIINSTQHLTLSQSVPLPSTQQSMTLSTSPTQTHQSSPRDNSTNRICMYYQNVRGLRTKTGKFKLSSNGCDYDIIALTETGLHSSIHDGELFNNNEFSIYRRDRSKANSTRERFGGVLLAVKSGIPSEEVIVPQTEDVELIVVKIHFKGKFVYVCNLYIPSNSPIAVYHRYTIALERVIDHIDLSVEERLYILGDFNMPNVRWRPSTNDVYSDYGFFSGTSFETKSLLPYNIDTSANAELLYTLLGAGLNQTNSDCNYQGNILDLVFCNESSDVTVRRSRSPMIKIDRYHEPLEIEFTLDTDDVVEFNSDDHEFNFKKADFVGLNAHLTSIDWDKELSEISHVDEVNDRFYELLTLGFNRFVPFKKKGTNSHPPWYGKSLLALKNRKSKAHKKYRDCVNTGKHPGCIKCYVEYCSLRNQFGAAQTRAYDSYVKNAEESLISDPLKFWSYVNVMRKTVGYPSLMFRGDKRTLTMQGKCDLFAEFLRDVFSDNSQVENIEFGLKKIIDIGSLSLSKEQILAALVRIDTSKGDGPDNISPLLLKNCSDALAEPLHRIFNLSLSTTFPTRWKESYVVPIFKNGSRSDVECYRGVAILPTFGKLFESIVCEQLTEKFRAVITVTQHGFMKGRSTTTNLIDFVNEAIRVVEKGNQLDAIYTDVRKAFDRVQHNSLLCKLKELGMHSTLLNWMKSYLCNRQQYVRLMGWKSQSYPVTSGIPQGSHLGPLLFLIFINDVMDAVKFSKCSLFADDLKIYRQVKTLRDCIALQRDLLALNRWFEHNSLELNVGKCVAMSFFKKRKPLRFAYGVAGSILKRVIEVRDLGVTLTEDLSFNRHMDIIIAKAYSMLGFMKRICNDFRNVAALKSIYFAHVRAHLEYASVVWSPYYQNYSDKIESIQKKFLIYALRRTVRRDESFRLPSYESRCESIKIESLSRRRFNLAAMFVFDILNGRVDSPSLRSKLRINIPARALRNNEYLVIESHRVNYGLYEPINHISRVFNMFAHLFAPSVTRPAFRSGIKAMELTGVTLRKHGFIMSAT